MDKFKENNPEEGFGVKIWCQIFTCDIYRTSTCTSVKSKDATPHRDDPHRRYGTTPTISDTYLDTYLKSVVRRLRNVI